MPEDRITWTNERRKLSELQPWPRNPRQIKADQAKRLAQSFDEFGQVETIAVGPGNEIYNGHQRLHVLQSQHGKDYEIEVRVASRALSEKEREKLTVFLHKGAAGEWDFDTLSEWDIPDLLDWGFNEWELHLAGADNPTLDDLADKYGEPEERSFWPVIKLQVSPETFEKYKSLMAALSGADEAEKFDALVSGYWSGGGKAHK